VNRTTPEEPPGAAAGPFLPEQALDLATAVHAYTAGSAWVNHLDDVGAIEVGRLADLVVTDRDPFAGPLERIGATRVVQTFVDGRRVHST
jgi:predicted amidohydrolase YtcJ